MRQRSKEELARVLDLAQKLPLCSRTLKSDADSMEAERRHTWAGLRRIKGRTRVLVCYAGTSRGLSGQRDARHSAVLVHPLAQG